MDMQKVDSARSLIAGVMHWAVTTGGFNSETVQDVMPGSGGTPLRQRASGVSSGVADR